MIRKRYALHSVPMLVVILLIIPLVTADVNIKVEVLRFPASFHSGVYMSTYYSAVVTLILVIGMVYLMAFMKECSFLLSIKYLRENNVPTILIVVMVLLCASGLLYVISIIMNNFVDDERIVYHAFIEVLSLLLLVTVVLIYWMSTGEVDYFRALRTQEEKHRYEKSRIKNLDIQAILPRLVHLMVEEKMFRDEEISLNKLSGHLGIEPYQLSEMINEKFSMNFSSYINGYRIEEAKRMLVDEKDRTIFSIAYAVGFNSPAPFYEWFQKLTGVSPAKYRKKASSRD